MAYIPLQFPVGIGEYLPAINTYLAIGNGASPEVYTVIANVGDQSGPDMTCDVVDVTSHSATTPWSRKGVTLLNAGTTKFPLFFIPQSSGAGSHGFSGGGLLANFVNRTLTYFLIQFPEVDLTQWLFQGYISAFSVKAAVKGAIMADVTIEFTDAPTLE